MDLKSYIKKKGVDECAEMFGVTPRAITAYLRGERKPRHEIALRIVESTKGRVSYAECYGQKRK